MSDMRPPVVGNGRTVGNAQPVVTPRVSVPATLLSANPAKWPHGEFVPLGTLDALRGLLLCVVGYTDADLSALGMRRTSRCVKDAEAILALIDSEPNRIEP